MRCIPWAPIVLVAGLLLAVGGAPERAAAADAKALAKQLKSKDVSERLEAVQVLKDDGADGAEGLLLGALDDRDWEVREWAADALATRGTAESVGPLVKSALVGPVRRVRLAAARSLFTLAPAEAAEQLAKRTGGKLAERAVEALASLAGLLERPDVEHAEPIRRAIVRALGSEEPRVRKAAARGLASLSPSERAAKLQKLMYDADVGVAAAAIDSVREAPHSECLEPLIVGLRRDDIKDVIERRLQAAVVAIVAMSEPGESAATAAAPVAVALQQGPSGVAAARLARIIGLLGKKPRQPTAEDAEPVPPLVPAEWALEQLEPALQHEAEEARAAAVRSLALIDSDAALDRAAASAAADPSPRVRLHALRTLQERRSVLHDRTLRLAVNLLEDDDALVREQAAVALGVKGVEGVVPSLVKALSDADWSVRLCAAVSLGKTKDPAAVAPLKEKFERAKDWKLRGAAVVGLGRVQQIDAVPVLIDALGVKETAIARSAYEFLRRLTSETIPPKPAAWRSWWEENRDGYVFIDREEEARTAQKFGYAPDLRGVYEGLDVIVLQSRGDHIEQLLEKLEIEHRITRGGSVPASELHPFSVFVSNCTGEITKKDVEQLQWYVRVGGYLFCSCWALHHTAELVYPGQVRKLGTLGQVLDNVESEACPTESVYLDGVFDGVTRPIYVLYGSHLIEVLDKERVEVLIDSPDCATRWGGGNLACWFTAGHGVILDSANHFDLQGLERAEGLKADDDRKAYAMDHMGLDYEELRELDAAKVWKSRSKASKAARDLSAFRFITNFVRHKRRVDP